MEIEAFLKKVSLFKGVSGQDLQVIGRIAKTREMKKGETIFSKSSPGDSLYIVSKGRVKIFIQSATGKTKIFDYLEPGDFFGEMALFSSLDRSAAAKAVEPSTVIIIHAKDFQGILRTRPDMSLSMLKTLCIRLRRADQEIESLSFNNVLGRIAKILLDLSDRYGKKTPAGVMIKMPLSHQELADMAGTAREMVTRVLNRFKRTGCLSIEGKTVTLTDPAKLQGWVF